MKFDIIIVGARVAGSSLAMLTAQAGMRTLLIDRCFPGQDTVSTHALMRAGVALLQRWGLLDKLKQAGTPAIRKTVFHYGSDKTELEIRERDGVDALYSPRRTALDPLLAQAALDNGAVTYFGASVRQVCFDESGRVNGVVMVDRDRRTRTFHADLVVGADGANSTVARAVHAFEFAHARFATSTLYGYWEGLELDSTHWIYGHGMAGGATPTNHGLTCVFAAQAPQRLRAIRPKDYLTFFYHQFDAMNPELAQALRRGPQRGRLHAFGGRPGFLRQAHGPGWALVGDAGCFKDPITAHGMTDALRDAAFLARAAIDGRASAFEAYQEKRDSIALELNELSDQIASFAWNLETLQPLHRQLSKLMNRECDLLPAPKAQRHDSALAYA